MTDGTGKTVAMVSLGCCKNLVDAESMLALLQNDGYAITTTAEDADVIIVNTCAFIESAKTESIQAILEAAEQKKHGRCQSLVVTGCLAERYGQELSDEMPEVDAFLGVAYVQDIAKTIGSGERCLLKGHISPRGYAGAPRVLSTPPYAAYVKIAEGCSNGCSYCAIPMIRGAYRSRTQEDIVREVRSLAESGVKEVTIVAQDTTRYGEDLGEKDALIHLLEALCKIDGIVWLRLLYLYPEKVSSALLDLMEREEKICRYLDVPIQHVHEDMLRSMRRRSTREQIDQLIGDVEKRGGFALRTSLIAGYPGETQAMHEEMLAFVKETRFHRLGVFAYSQEEGTAAAKLPGQLPEEIKQARRDALMLAQQEVSLARNKERVGTVEKVLVEGQDEDGGYIGRSEYEAMEIDGKVFFTAGERLMPGDFVMVHITGAWEYDVVGEALS